MGLFCFSPYIIHVGLNGLETSLAALQWMISLDLYLGRVRQTGGTFLDRSLLAASLALLVFSRVDGVLPALAIAADFLLRPLPGAPPFSDRLRFLFHFGAGALIIYSPWLIYSGLHFGTIFPQSGAAVRATALLYGDMELPLATGKVSAGQIPPNFYFAHLIHALTVLNSEDLFFPAGLPLFLFRLAKMAGASPLLTSWPIIAGLALAGLVLGRWCEREMDVLFLAVCFMIIAYSFAIFGAWFFFRYFYPVEMCLILLGASLFHHLGNRLPPADGSRRRRWWLFFTQALSAWAPTVFLPCPVTSISSITRRSGRALIGIVPGRKEWELSRRERRGIFRSGRGSTLTA